MAKEEIKLSIEMVAGLITDPLQWLFLILKWCGVIDWDWWVVMLPTIILGSVYVVCMAVLIILEIKLRK